MDGQRVYSGAPWERQVGYCRAIRSGAQIWVSGTASVDADGSTHAPGDAYRQTQRCLAIAAEAIVDLGGTMADVVRTRLFVTDIERWAEYGKAHREAFGASPPATSMLEVKRLIAPDMLVEIELEAVLGE